MNIKNISAAVSAIVLFGVAGAALAESRYPDDVQFVSTKTRAEVIAELQQAQANGQIINNDGYPGNVGQVKSQLTRAQVIEELKQARANGETLANDYYSGPVTMTASSTKTRAEVVAELKQYQQAHANAGNAEAVFLR
eukprot:gene35886-45927_t